MIPIPITRIEKYLYEIITEAQSGRAPITRVERYLNRILGGNNTIPVPVLRIEKYLAKIAGEDVDTPAPITRIEMYLAKKAGQDVEPPEPITRLEHYLAEWAEMESETIVTVTGTLPLVLANSLADYIVRLVRYGKVEQPPVDYLSTVTQSGAVEQRNLPQGFTEREYIQSSGTQYIDTGLKGNGTTKVRVEYCWHESSSVASSGRIFGSRTTSSSEAFAAGSTDGMTSIRIPFASFDNQAFIAGVATDAIDIGEWFTIEVSVDGFFVNGTQIGSAWTAETFETPQTLKLFGFNNNVTMGYGIGRCKRYQRWDNGVLTQDIVSATRDSDNAAGMYDKVSGQFLTNEGTGDFVAGPAATPTPERPMDLWTNNGKLVYKDAELPVGYKRLKDIIFDGEVYYITNTYLTGADTTSCTINATENARNVLGCYTGVGTGDNISFYLNVGGGGNYVRYKSDLYRPQLNDGTLGQDRTLSITPTGTTGFDTNASWTAQTFTCPDPLYIGWLANATSPKFLGVFKGDVTVSSRAKFIPCERQSDGEIGYYDVNSNVFFENQGTGTPTTSGYDDTHKTILPDGTPSTITDADGNTATLETLLACGDYKDTQELIAGLRTHNVGARVLTGADDENWMMATATDLVQFYTSAFSSEIMGNVSIMSTVAPYGCTVAHRTEYDFGCYSGGTGNLCFQMKGDPTLSTNALFKARLRSDLAAGKPWIVLYPLATPTTESVEGQVLVNEPLTVSAEVTLPAPVTTEAAVSTPDPKHPLPLWCNNGELAYGQYGKNLFNKTAIDANWKVGYIINNSGNEVVDGVSCYSTYFIPIKPNTKYIASWVGSGSALQRFYWYTADGAFISRSDFPTVARTSPANAAYMRVQRTNEAYLAATDIQIEEGSTSTAYEPYHFGLHTDGTPEVLTVRGVNLVDLNAVTNGYYYSQSGTYSQVTDCRLTDYIPVKAGEKYTVWAQAEALSSNANVRANLFDRSQTWLSQTSVVLNSTAQPKVLVVTPTVDGYLRVSANYQSENRADWSTLRVSQGEYTVATMPSYEPYHEPQTASVPMLLAVGNYKDSAELIAGIKTGKVGVKVFDGTEGWYASTAYGGSFFVLDAMTSWGAVSGENNLCTHFSRTVFNSGNKHFYVVSSAFNSATAFAAFLASEYAAGNPVILLYPLAEETTEQGSPQSLNTYAGVTLIDTECYVEPVDGEAEYKYGTTPTPPPVPDTDCIEFSSSAPFTLATANSTKNWDGTLYTAPDAITWSEWDGREAVSSSNDGKLYVRGSGNTMISGNADGKGWALTGRNISCSGDIRYLLDHDTPERPTMATGCFYGLFKDCTALTSAPELPATTLAASCYREMFSGCTSLTTPPELPARTLAASCYREMFYNCTALTSAPELPATTMVAVCYYRMFYNCTALTTAPDLPATTLAANCYSYMFISCTSLRTPPALPATTLADNCYYYMFYSCTALAALPELPADRLVSNCYAHMFHGCSAIKVSDREVGDYTVKYQTIPPVDTGSVEELADAAEMFKGTGGDFTGTPYSDTKYFLDKNNSVIPATRARLTILAGSPQPDMSEEDAQTAINIITGEGDR